LAERPVADSRAVRQRAPLPPEDEVGRGVEPGEQLRDEPRLADSRHTDERHELRLALAARALEPGEQGLELARPADERKPAALLEIHPEPRAGVHGLPHRER